MKRSVVLLLAAAFASLAVTQSNGQSPANPPAAPLHKTRQGELRLSLTDSTWRRTRQPPIRSAGLLAAKGPKRCFTLQTRLGFIHCGRILPGRAIHPLCTSSIFRTRWELSRGTARSRALLLHIRRCAGAVSRRNLSLEGRSRFAPAWAPASGSPLLVVVGGPDRAQIDAGLGQIQGDGTDAKPARAKYFFDHRLWYDAVDAYSDLIGKNPSPGLRFTRCAEHSTTRFRPPAPGRCRFCAY